MARNSDNSNKTADPATDIDRVWSLAKDIRTCMLVTQSNELRARPMSAHVVQEEEAIYFLDKAGSAKEFEIEGHAGVVLIFADNDKNKFITLHGTARVTNDREKIRALWSNFYKAYFDSAEDPNIHLITVVPQKAELWDGLNNIAASGAMLVSAITGAKPVLGHEAEVRL